MNDDEQKNFNVGLTAIIFVVATSLAIGGWHGWPAGFATLAVLSGVALLVQMAA